MIGSIAQRVASTAKLAGIKGSLAKRKEIASGLNAQFYGMVSDIFERQGEVSLTQIQRFLKKLCPGIKLNVKQNDHKAFIGRLRYLEKKKKIIGYELMLPTVESTKKDNSIFGKFTRLVKSVILPYESSGKEVLKKEHLENLFHETRHLFDRITDSVSLARVNAIPLKGKFKGYSERSNKYINFCFSKLYPPEFKLQEIREMGVNSSTIISNKKSTIRKGIEEVFDDPQVTYEEKIEVLEQWRSNLRTEQNACVDGIAYKNKFNKKQPTEEDSGIIDRFFYKGKIEVIEEVLAEELAKARNKHAESLGLVGNHHTKQQDFVVEWDDAI